jgi:hypothetical protein
MKNNDIIFTRKQYMNKEVSHHDYYLQFVTQNTEDFVLSDLSIQQIKNAIMSGDEHLNRIKIPFNNMGNGGTWWWDHAPINILLIKKAGQNKSNSTHTCVAKAAARNLIK